MAKPLSSDLRLRIIRAVEDEGMSCRGAASRFGVAPSTAIELVSEFGVLRSPQHHLQKNIARQRAGSAGRGRRARGVEGISA